MTRINLISQKTTRFKTQFAFWIKLLLFTVGFALPELPSLTGRPIFTSTIVSDQRPSFTPRTVMFINNNSVTKHLSGVQLRGSTLGHSNKICPGDPYSSEFGTGFCSGCQISPDTIVTARHCVFKPPYLTGGRDVINNNFCSENSIVFNYTERNQLIKNNDVTNCKSMILEGNANNSDVVFIKIPHRDGNGAFPKLSSGFKRGDQLIAGSHPFGIRQTLATGKVTGTIKNALGSHHGSLITSDLPVHPGSSGSCVYNKQGEVTGIVALGTVNNLKAKRGFWRRKCFNINESRNNQYYSTIVPSNLFQDYYNHAVGTPSHLLATPRQPYNWRYPASVPIHSNTNHHSCGSAQ